MVPKKSLYYKLILYAVMPQLMTWQLTLLVVIVTQLLMACSVAQNSENSKTRWYISALNTVWQDGIWAHQKSLNQTEHYLGSGLTYKFWLLVEGRCLLLSDAALTVVLHIPKIIYVWSGALCSLSPHQRVCATAGSHVPLKYLQMFLFCAVSVNLHQSAFIESDDSDWEKAHIISLNTD